MLCPLSYEGKVDDFSVAGILFYPYIYLCFRPAVIGLLTTSGCLELHALQSKRINRLHPITTHPI